jgi:hypothetical protein
MVPFVFGHIQPLDSITPPTANGIHFTEFFAKPEELARQFFIQEFQYIRFSASA